MIGPCEPKSPRWHKVTTSFRLEDTRHAAVHAFINVASPWAADGDGRRLVERPARRPRHVDRADDVSPDLGEIVAVRLRVGQDLLGDPIPRDPPLVNQFVVKDADTAASRSSAATAAIRRVSCAWRRPGCSWSAITATRARRDAGGQVQSVPEGRRARRGRRRCGPAAASPAPVRARSSRAARRAWCSRDRRPRRRAIGRSVSRSSSSPKRNPYALRPDQDLPVRLTYENRPLAGALVVAINRLNPAEKLTGRTDKDGRVRFQLRAGRHVAGQGRSHGSGACRQPRRTGPATGRR